MLRKFIELFTVSGPIEGAPWMKVRHDWFTGRWWVEVDTAHLMKKWLSESESPQ
jgi:hypothetical protein